MEVDPPRPTAAALESPAAREKIKLHGLKRSRVSRAVKALLKHIAIQRAQTNSLIEDDEILYLVSKATLLRRLRHLFHRVCSPIDITFCLADFSAD